MWEYLDASSTTPQQFVCDKENVVTRSEAGTHAWLRVTEEDRCSRCGAFLHVLDWMRREDYRHWCLVGLVWMLVWMRRTLGRAYVMRRSR